MRARAYSGIAVAVLLSLTIACGTDADDTGGEPPAPVDGATVGPTEAGYRDARRLLERGLETLGDELLGDGLLVRARGTLDPGVELQGRSPGARASVPFTEVLAVEQVDDGDDRVAWEYRQERLDGTSEWIREIYRGPEERLLILLEDSFSMMLRSPRHRAARRRISRRLPGVLLQEALESPTTLRDLGPGEGTRAVAFTLADGTGMTLLLDPDSGLPRRAEVLVEVPGLGDTLVGHEWTDYEPLERGVFPRRYRVTLGDRTYTDMRVEAVERGETVAAFMSRPDGIAAPNEVDLPERPDPTARATVREVAPGVHLVVGLRTGFHLMFVETADGVVAVDAPSGYLMLNELPPSDVAPAPSSSWLSQRYLELVRQAVPGKPVSHVVLTHFHGDHAGGLRAFVAAGAEVIATSAAVPGIERMLGAPYTLGPDPLSGAAPEPRIRVAEGPIVLGDDDRRIEILDVGANPHSEQMLVVHLPDQEILYVADLLTAAPLERFPDASHATLDRFFADWLAERGLTPARIYTSHGSLTVTPEHLARLDGDPEPE